MIKSMPEMAKLLLDKCISTKGSKDHPNSYQVMYDFFCLESKGNNRMEPGIITLITLSSTLIIMHITKNLFQ